MPNLCFQDITNLFDLGVSKSKIPHSVVGKYMNTLLSNQEVPIFFATFGRPVLVTFSLLESKGEREKERKKGKMSNYQGVTFDFMSTVKHKTCRDS